MKVPADFDRALWLDPLTFEGLVGASIASGIYSRLFRADGFAKPIAELREDPKIAELIDGLRKGSKPERPRPCNRAWFTRARSEGCARNDPK